MERKTKINDLREQLDLIIKYFESEEIDLDLAISKYEEASKLVLQLEEILKKYETKIQKLKASKLE